MWETTTIWKVTYSNSALKKIYWDINTWKKEIGNATPIIPLWETTSIKVKNIIENI